MTTNLNKTDIVISISNLNVTRGKSEVLTNFDLDIDKGSITGLLGPSGCGKTTLMRSIVGLQIIKSGNV
jgi:ABC-2 type transport system ATP-binding protein